MNGTLSLAQRYLYVIDRIRRAAEAVGRNPGSVQLLAVGKTFPAGSIGELAMAGQTAFGENYLQEALVKMTALAHLRGPRPADEPHERGSGMPARVAPGCLEWHFIGPIQSNKTRKLAESFDWVQTVENEKIARRLSAQRPPHLPPLQVCLQVNVSGEPSKSGCEPDQVEMLAALVARLPHLRLRGLMAIPEPTDDPALQAERFGQVKTLFEGVRVSLPPSQTGAGGFDTLSMGMSSDLEAAIAQGATMVRIGTDLFGARQRSV